MNKKSLIKVIGLTTVIASSAAIADNNWYAGISIGESDIDVSGFDDGDSFAITAGYNVNKNMAIELAYVDLGESDFDEPGQTASVEADGFNLAVVGKLPLNEQFNLFAKIGMYMWDADSEASGFITGSDSEDGTDLSYGVGASYDLNDQFALSLEYQRFDVDDIDVDNISIGLRFNF